MTICNKIKAKHVQVKRKLIPAKSKKGKATITLSAVCNFNSLKFRSAKKLKAEPTPEDFLKFQKECTINFNQQLMDARPPQMYPDLP